MDIKKNKYKFIGVVWSLLLIAAGIGMTAYANERDSATVQGVFEDMRNSQNVSNNSDINCNRVSEAQFEKLGDSYMDVIQPNEDRHKLMDRMMGGEGSDSLRSMHILMGQRYLGCGNYMGDSSYDSMMGSGVINGMMGGSGMMGGFTDNTIQKGGVGSMMGNYGYGNMGSWAGFGLGWIFMILFWGLVIWGILALVKNSSGRNEEKKGNSALEILKERYAKGEIGKEEFENKKKDLN